jgi:hypothetical protein
MKPNTYPPDWPTCATEGCEKPTKRSQYGSPRQWCSACQKARETAQNETKKCDVKACTRHRLQARRYCSWHVVQLYKAAPPYTPRKKEAA